MTSSAIVRMAILMDLLLVAATFAAQFYCGRWAAILEEAK
jgi:hypothetical protein